MWVASVISQSTMSSYDFVGRINQCHHWVPNAHFSHCHSAVSSPKPAMRHRHLVAVSSTSHCASGVCSTMPFCPAGPRGCAALWIEFQGDVPFFAVEHLVMTRFPCSTCRFGGGPCLLFAYVRRGSRSAYCVTLLFCPAKRNRLLLQAGLHYAKLELDGSASTGICLAF